jgi:hypothetical protein
MARFMSCKPDSRPHLITLHDLNQAAAQRRQHNHVGLETEAIAPERAGSDGIPVCIATAGASVAGIGTAQLAGDSQRGNANAALTE